MTREEAKLLLEQGETLKVRSVLYYNKLNMYCDETDCCNYSFDTVDETLDHIDSIIYDWDDVEYSWICDGCKKACKDEGINVRLKPRI